MTGSQIESPEDPALDRLCEQLASQAGPTDLADAWPAQQLRQCAEAGVLRWFLGSEDGGMGWSEPDLIRGTMRLSSACMNTAFILTQATGALRRIADVGSKSVKSLCLPAILSGTKFATLGISHLTTSRRHLAKTALRAEETDEGFRLDGFSPWVTGGCQADWIVTGAQLDDGRQVLAVLPTDLPGVTTDEPTRLVGLTASHTGAVRLSDVELDRRWLLAGPEENVMQSATGAKTGGLQTSALAVGLADGAIRLLESEADRRPDLNDPAESLRAEQTRIADSLLAAADGTPTCSAEQLRSSANSLALRTSQAALAAAKGTGYVQGHVAGRLCREALFFLVWSCPQPVLVANLCELAGITD